MIKPYLEAAKVVSTHGVMGEVRAQCYCDDPEILCHLSMLYLDAQGKHPIGLQQGRVHKNVVILKLDGVNSLEDAQELRGKMLYLDRKDLVLEPGQYFIQDLLGSTVADAEEPEKVYGVLVDVTNTGASDIYHIKAPDGRLLLAPAIPQVVKQVDPEQEKILITPLEGLFD